MLEVCGLKISYEMEESLQSQKSWLYIHIKYQSWDYCDCKLSCGIYLTTEH